MARPDADEGAVAAGLEALEHVLGSDAVLEIYWYHTGMDRFSD